MTTIAVFSDLHGNTPALQALLTDLEEVRPELVVNLGDIASGGVDPAGTMALLATRPEIIAVRGNHERQLTTLEPERMSRSDRLAHDTLAPDEIAALGRLPERKEVVSGVLAFHGSPSDDLRYLLQTVDPSAPDALREATDDEVIDRLGADAGRYEVYLCGHTHLQRVRRLADGSVVVNPGSLGWPAYDDDAPYPHLVEAGSPQARYTLLRSTDAGWEIVEKALDYDVESAVAMAEGNARADVAHALRTGRVSRSEG
ncbi:metallophosphatase family protein [Isoptericola sp. 4D.3]|uniref:Metallophosphatase family protein n=1 Tax=Isoptericola peretonis TaxID=2918523 RepID=A0ABT0J4Z0_9MICO|nr:metallophosphatase family protein [Isoptericola sp. 4D.3]